MSALSSTFSGTGAICATMAYGAIRYISMRMLLWGATKRDPLTVAAWGDALCVGLQGGHRLIH